MKIAASIRRHSGHRTSITASTARKAKSAYANDDSTTALKIWQELAQAGNAEAQLELGNAYTDGRLIPKDDAMAVHWWRKSAAQGDWRTQQNLLNLRRMLQGDTSDPLLRTTSLDP